MKNFNSPDFTIVFIYGGLEMNYRYLNGYQAKLSQHKRSKGGDVELWELQVEYRTPLECGRYDVKRVKSNIGWMTLGQVAVALADIANLPKRPAKILREKGRVISYGW
jgi:hypothetical protein